MWHTYENAGKTLRVQKLKKIKKRLFCFQLRSPFGFPSIDNKMRSKWEKNIATALSG